MVSIWHPPSYYCPPFVTLAVCVSVSFKALSWRNCTAVFWSKASFGSCMFGHSVICCDGQLMCYMQTCCVLNPTLWSFLNENQTGWVLCLHITVAQIKMLFFCNYQQLPVLFDIFISIRRVLDSVIERFNSEAWVVRSCWRLAAWMRWSRRRRGRRWAGEMWRPISWHVSDESANCANAPLWYIWCVHLFFSFIY